MSTDNVAIRVENLTKVYKLYDKPVDRLKESLHPFRKTYHQDFYALNDVSFEVKNGEILGLIGKNGSGKSTLLKIITGILKPTLGTVQVNGKISALLELGAGFNPELNGIENVYLNGTIMGYTKEEMDQKLDEILSFADIGDFVYQPVKMYSSGMFARLAFAVNVAVNPEILIVDEALSVGDVRFRQKAIRKMQEIMGQAKAIIFVTHDMESIKSFCNRVIWLKDGRLFKEGHPKQIVQWYYNYMIHDVLPDEESVDVKLISKDDFKEREFSTLKWLDTKEADISTTGDVDIKEVAFYEKRTLKSVDVLTGKEEELIFAVNMRVKRRINQPILGFGIFNSKGIPIIHYNSSTIKTNIETLHPSDDLIIKFNVPIPKLQNGTYTVSIGVDEGILGEHRMVCHVRECYIFKVIRNDVFSKQYGLIVLEEATIAIENK